jgi:predicted transcriptional regulator
LPAPNKAQPDFQDAASKGPPQIEIQRFFAAVSANDVRGVLNFVMAYPNEASTMKGSENMTALMFAAREGLKETAWILIHAKGDLEIGNDNDSTALMFAAHAGKATIVAMLLEAGADVNHVNKNGHTPLMSAAANGFKNTAEQLLKFNADVTPKDAKENDAFAYATENGFADIARMIEAAGATQQAVREKAAADAKAAAEAQNKPLITDDGGAAMKDLERRMIKAKLAYPASSPDKPDETKDDTAADEARDALKKISKKMDKDGPLF